jgi:hypothetical protein
MLKSDLCPLVQMWELKNRRTAPPLSPFGRNTEPGRTGLITHRTAANRQRRTCGSPGNPDFRTSMFLATD